MDVLEVLEMEIGVYKMKKLKMKEIYNLNIEDLSLREEECLKGLETLDLEKTHLEDVITHTSYKTMYGVINNYDTEFYFKTEDGTVISVILRENKKASDIDSYKNTCRQVLNDIIWEQFVEHFNLRIRLMFIDEYMPWKWNKEFTY